MLGRLGFGVSVTGFNGVGIAIYGAIGRMLSTDI